MKNFITLLLCICCCFNCNAQELHISNYKTSAKLIIESKPKRFQISSFCICPYDAIEYVIFHNWASPDISYIHPFDYRDFYELQNLVSEQEKQSRCHTLQNANELAIVELPDSVTNITHKHIDNTLQFTCQTWSKHLDNITGYLTITSANKYSKFYFGYGGYGGENKKPVIILYN